MLSDASEEEHKAYYTEHDTKERINEDSYFKKHEKRYKDEIHSVTNEGGQQAAIGAGERDEIDRAIYNHLKGDVYKRSGLKLDYSYDGKADLDQLETLKISESNQVEDSDDDQVYNLSRKYVRSDARHTMILRYIILAIIIFLFTPADLYTGLASRKSPIRIGYFADVSEEKSIDINGVTEFAFEVTN